MSTGTNSSVDQVFDVLAVLSTSEEAIGVAQLARTLGVPTSTAHRLLITLQEASYVERDTTGMRYQLGLGAQELTHALLQRFPIQTASQPYLRRLAAATGDTVVLTGRIGWYSVRMASAEGWREVHAAPRLGQASRLEDTPGGRAILAFLDTEARDGYLRWRAGGARLSSKLRQVRSEVEAVRARGHVHDHHPDGRQDIAFPLRDETARVVASIAIEAAERDGGARGERRRISQAGVIVAEIEELLREQPHLAADPFAHLSPDELDPRVAIAAPG